jgi:hypothetical protein
MLLIFNFSRHIRKHYQTLSDRLLTISEIKYFINKNITGYDERYSKNLTTNDNDNDNNNTYEIYKLLLLYDKKQLLDVLKNEKISINTKLELVKNNSIITPNLYAGGLFRDWDYDN